MKKATPLLYYQSSQRGGALILFLLSLFAILAIIAITLDFGRFQTIIRSLQHAADSAALSAAATLHATDEDGHATDEDGHATDEDGSGASTTEANTSANVKKAVLTILNHGEIIGLDETAKVALCIDQPAECSIQATTFRFDDGTSNSSSPDWPNYGRISGVRGNLKVTVERLIFCYSGSSAHPVRNFINLDDPSLTFRMSQFCKANAVRVTLTLSHINTFFGRILGIAELSSVKSTSIAIANQEIPASGGVCHSTTCSGLGIGLLGAYGGTDTTCIGSQVPG